MFVHAPGKDVAQVILDARLEDWYTTPGVAHQHWIRWPKCQYFLNEHMKESGLPDVLPFIRYNLHVVHNAFCKGLDVFGENAEQLVLVIFYYST